MKQMTNRKNIVDWSHDVIHGVGGLLDYKRYELAMWNGCEPMPDEAHEHKPTLCEAAAWAVKCLTNPDYAEILAAVVSKAKRNKVTRPKKH